MDKHRLSEPHILIPALFAVWAITAAVYAVVFTY